jgi:uncharacterized membrane protein YphA (DoxX/SURF4 family)
LGLVLLLKGIQIANHLNVFSEMMAKSKLPASFAISLLAHLVILLHIIGGFLIAIGTNTRVACLVQIPVLLVAVFYVNLPAGVATFYSEFWLSVSVLIGLVFFMIEGNGPLSVEHRETKELSK